MLLSAIVSLPLTIVLSRVSSNAWLIHSLMRYLWGWQAEAELKGLSDIFKRSFANSSSPTQTSRS